MSTVRLFIEGEGVGGRSDWGRQRRVEEEGFARSLGPYLQPGISFLFLVVEDLVQGGPAAALGTATNPQDMWFHLYKKNSAYGRHQLS